MSKPDSDSRRVPLPYMYTRVFLHRHKHKHARSTHSSKNKCFCYRWEGWGWTGWRNFNSCLGLICTWLGNTPHSPSATQESLVQSERSVLKTNKRGSANLFEKTVRTSSLRRRLAGPLWVITLMETLTKTPQIWWKCVWRCLTWRNRWK